MASDRTAAGQPETGSHGGPVVLTDIEGTTTDIAFVSEVLFPFARARLRDFLHANAHLPEVAAALDDVRARIRAEGGALPAPTGGRVEAGRDGEIDALADRLIAWIDADAKITPLKTLQGLIWADGYADGTLRAHLYPEVAAALRRWHAAGVTLAVYSSGSVAAQLLLFGHTEAGDLNPLFSHNFDTTTGLKVEAGSYTKIAAALGRPPRDILFLSDHPGEIAAARSAGMAVIRLDRSRAPGSPITPDDLGVPVAADFDAIDPFAICGMASV
ncbi:acireductone synthase (plasmid) [Tistrella mobilis]|uniref:acireductone synthase n=1 Tax=Tistrella mobilis TaxID=171437 RepID=UPI0035584223